MLTLRAIERGDVVEPAHADEAATFFRAVGASRYLARTDPGLGSIRSGSEP
ncbi:MAG: hypothetical protein ACR2MU_01690 [Gaiellaceae bacterium]